MKNNINRRNFLRATTAAAGAGLLIPSTLFAQGKTPAPAKPAAPQFEKRPLGKTGVSLPILSMGVMKADNPSLVKAAMRSGIFHFDTAHGYQGGNNEKMLGAIFKGMKRDSFFVATKVNLRGDVLAENAPERFMEMFNTSMTRLGLDYVDILYIHAISKPEVALHKPLHAVLQKLKKAGRVRFSGISTHSNEPAVIDAAIEAGVFDVILTAYNFKKQREVDIKSAIARAAKAGIGIVAMKAMAGAKNINCSAALKWVLQDKNVTTAIPGVLNFDQLDDCIEAAKNLACTDEEKAFLASAGTVDSLYCLGCNQCDGQCPQSLPIPDLMRAYMYAHGYRHPGLAKETILALDLPKNPCAGCDTCTVNCRAGFRVGEKIADIARITRVPDEFLV